MRKRTFTLIELLAAIGIIAILAAITVGGLSFATAKADYSKTQSTIEKFGIALENFKADYGYYPIQEIAGDLNTTGDDSPVKEKKGWQLFTNTYTEKNKINRPYFDGEPGVIEDAYGEPLQYQYPNSVDARNITKYALWSKGKDKKSGASGTDTSNNAGEKGSDDICSWLAN